MVRRVWGLKMLTLEEMCKTNARDLELENGLQDCKPGSWEKLMSLGTALLGDTNWKILRGAKQTEPYFVWQNEKHLLGWHGNSNQIAWILQIE